MKTLKRTNGLTLLETILVSSLISIVALTLYNALSNGLKVWDRVHQFVIEEDIALFLNEISEELHNAYVMEEMPFEGQPHRIAFPTIVLTLEDPKISGGRDNYIHQPGRVQYFFDTSQKNLYRQQANYSLALGGRFFEKREVLGSLKEVRFLYYTVNEDKIIELSHTKSWPMMIKVMVRFADLAGNERVMEKSVVMPLYAGGNV